MSSRTVWILLALVLLLGGVVLWQQGREKDPRFLAERPLFDGLLPERVSSVHLDHLERGLQLSIERDANGAWQIVDPLEFPAEAGVMERLLEVASKNRGTLVDEPDLKGMSLAPPRAVLDLTEKRPEGERKLRLELGAQDLDGKHVYARVDGVVVRTLLNLDSTLDRDLPDWRQRRILNVDPAMVVELRRTGRFALDAEAPVVDLAFEAGTAETGWRATAPWNAALDPDAMGSLLATVCFLQARSFLADSPLQLPALGLDRPDLRIELSLAGGGEVALVLKREPERESWTCMREGSVHAFRVDGVEGVMLAAPSDGFLDARIARADSAKVERIELRRGDETLSLRRNGAAWILAGKRGQEARPEVGADAAAVTDLLAKLAQARAAKFLIDAPAPEFRQAEPLGLRLFTREAELGCDFGAAHDVGPGIPGRLFRRAGDDVVGIVEDQVAALAAGTWTDFVERQLIKLPEKAIARIELAHGAAKRVFVRDAETGRWSPEGTDAEAPKAFLKCVERLLSLRADVAVALDAPFELADAWQVVVVDGGSVRYAYKVGGLASDPKQHGFDDGRVRGVITSSGLYDDLGRIP